MHKNVLKLDIYFLNFFHQTFWCFFGLEVSSNKLATLLIESHRLFVAAKQEFAIYVQYNPWTKIQYLHYKTCDRTAWTLFLISQPLLIHSCTIVHGKRRRTQRRRLRSFKIMALKTGLLGH